MAKKNAATETVSNVTSTFRNVAGKVFTAAKWTSTISGAFALVAVTSGAAAAAIPGMTLSSYIGLSATGVGQVGAWGVEGIGALNDLVNG